jgi:hypothetical protein
MTNSRPAPSRTLISRKNREEAHYASTGGPSSGALGGLLVAPSTSTAHALGYTFTDINGASVPTRKHGVLSGLPGRITHFGSVFRIRARSPARARADGKGGRK